MKTTIIIFVGLILSIIIYGCNDNDNEVINVLTPKDNFFGLKIDSVEFTFHSDYKYVINSFRVKIENYSDYDYFNVVMNVLFPIGVEEIDEFRITLKGVFPAKSVVILSIPYLENKYTFGDDLYYLKDKYKHYISIVEADIIEKISIDEIKEIIKVKEVRDNIFYIRMKNNY